MHWNNFLYTLVGFVWSLKKTLKSLDFQKTNLKIQDPEESAKNLIKIIDQINPSQTGKFFNWDGSELPW